MKQIAMDSLVRTERGKGVARKLRQAGRIPGVLYGRASEPVSFSVDFHEFNKILIRHKGEQVFFSLNLQDKEGTDNRLAIVKDLQLHPVTDQIYHIDFLEVAMDKEVTVEVPLTTVGEPAGVRLEGGMLQFLRRYVTVSALPAAVPDEIEVDVTELNVGETLHISDVNPPEGSTLMDEPETTLVTVAGAAVKEKAEEEVEAEEGVEAEAEETEE
ncbi:MAG TPA: 50S ribosomal protein L25 [Thermodesulfobacteriaceae bacterium]|nr:50S ribosomal protein L25 [Thermodesulfobacteriaceae bacterium]